MKHNLWNIVLIVAIYMPARAQHEQQAETILTERVQRLKEIIISQGTDIRCMDLITFSTDTDTLAFVRAYGALQDCLRNNGNEHFTSLVRLITNRHAAERQRSAAIKLAHEMLDHGAQPITSHPHPLYFLTELLSNVDSEEQTLKKRINAITPVATVSVGLQNN